MIESRRRTIRWRRRRRRWRWLLSWHIMVSCKTNERSAKEIASSTARFKTRLREQIGTEKQQASGRESAPGRGQEGTPAKDVRKHEGFHVAQQRARRKSCHRHPTKTSYETTSHKITMSLDKYAHLLRLLLLLRITTTYLLPTMCDYSCYYYC